MERKIVIGGELRASGDTYEVKSPYDGSDVATVHRARPEDQREAIDRAQKAFEGQKIAPTYKRYEVLSRAARIIADKEDELALEESYNNPGKYERDKIKPGSNWEIMKPTKLDILGFGGSWILVGMIILLLWLMTSIK